MMLRWFSHMWRAFTSYVKYERVLRSRVRDHAVSLYLWSITSYNVPRLPFDVTDTSQLPSPMYTA